MLDALNVQGTTDAPYTHTANPLCERQNCVVVKNLGLLLKQACTKGWVRLLPSPVLRMNFERSSSTPFKLLANCFMGDVLRGFSKNPSLKIARAVYEIGRDYKEESDNLSKANSNKFVNVR